MANQSRQLRGRIKSVQNTRRITRTQELVATSKLKRAQDRVVAAGESNDLYLVANTISTLDALSRGLIPGLSQGCCVVTGTAFDLPMVIQVDRLPTNKQPASEDVDLEKLWSADPAGAAAT